MDGDSDDQTNSNKSNSKKAQKTSCKKGKCFKCGKKVCISHCVKCYLCNKRTCKEKNCISDFRICQMCEYTFCQEHFEVHRKFNASDLYNKIRCTTEKCKLSQPIAPKGIDEFMKTILHACNIKELRLQENDIGDKGMLLLANSVRMMEHLEILYLCIVVNRQ